MTTANQFHAGTHPASAKFAEHLHALRTHCRSFAACVRKEYTGIEQAINDGVPLEAIVHALSESYGVQGSLAGLKSALSRIRRAIDGQACQQWLDTTASAPLGHGGMPRESSPQPPMMNPHMSPSSIHQPNVPFSEPARQSFPGPGPTMSGVWPYQSTQHYPSGPAPFPGAGQVHPWNQPAAPYNPYPYNNN